jgi:hypothetical protein
MRPRRRAGEGSTGDGAPVEGDDGGGSCQHDGDRDAVRKAERIGEGGCGALREGVTHGRSMRNRVGTADRILGGGSQLHWQSEAGEIEPRSVRSVDDASDDGDAERGTDFPGGVVDG